MRERKEKMMSEAGTMPLAERTMMAARALSWRKDRKRRRRVGGLWDLVKESSVFCLWICSLNEVGIVPTPPDIVRVSVMMMMVVVVVVLCWVWGKRGGEEERECMHGRVRGRRDGVHG